MIMINPAIINLEKELEKEKVEIAQKETAFKETVTKSLTLNDDIKKAEAAILAKKTEIARLEQDILAKKNELRRNDTAHGVLQNEIRVLKQRQDSNRLQVTRLSGKQQDEERKEQMEKALGKNSNN